MIDLFFSESAVWFSAIAFFGTGIFLLRLLLMMVGVGDFDGGDIDVGGDADVGVGLLSVNGVGGMLMGFGWGGLIAYRSFDLSFLVSIICGVAAGIALGWLIVMMFRAMHKLESSGTVDSGHCIGEIATVYTALPADPNGRGRVRVVVDGRMRYYPARSQTGKIARGAKVRVLEMDADRTALVELSTNAPSLEEETQ